MRFISNIFFLFFVCNFCALYGMDAQKNITSKRWQEMANELGQLTTLFAQPVPKYGMHSATSVNDARKEVQYQLALRSEDPIAALQAVGEPASIDLSGLGNTRRQGMQQFKLAHYARGIKLLEAYGHTAQAERALQDAQGVNTYLSHEEPVRHAASFARLLLEKRYDDAFAHLILLDRLVPAYPCWKPVVAIERAMLADVQHMPTLLHLASQGDSASQQYLLTDVCQRALELPIEKQSELFKPLIPHFEYWAQNPAQPQHLELFLQYGGALAAYEEKQYTQAFDIVIDVCKTTKDNATLAPINKLGKKLCEALAKAGDVGAQAYGAVEQLTSKNKKVKAQGVQLAQKLVRDCMKGKVHSEARLLKAGLFAQLEILSQQPAVCPLYAEWLCYQTVAGAQELDIQTAIARFKEIQRCAKNGLPVANSNKELLEQMVTFAQAVLAFYTNNANAALALTDFVHLCTLKHHLIKPMHAYAQKLFEQLVAQEQFDACVIKAQMLLHAQKGALSAEALLSCRTLLQKYAMQTTTLHHETELRLGLVFADVAARGDDAHIKYEFSRALFRLRHTRLEQTGLAPENIELFTDLLKYVFAAQQAQVPGAAPFFRALVLYRGALGLLAQSKDQEVPEKLCELLALDLPEPEKQLCVSFARYQLEELAHAGNLMAGAWHIQDLLATGETKQIEKALSVCDTVFRGLLDIDSTCPNWQGALEPFKKYAVVQTLEALGSDPQLELAGSIAYTLSLAYLLQSSTPYVFIGDTELPMQTALEKALFYAQQAYVAMPEKEKESAREQLGCVYYALGQNYLKNNEFEAGTEWLAKGSYLPHGPCMRACAMLVLEQPPIEGTKITKKMFDIQIGMIKRAYELGDTAAGAILADHLFDGVAHPFACGHSLEQDIKQACHLIQEVGNEYPQCARITGYLSYAESIRNAKKGKCVDLSSAAALLMQAAENNQVRAYAHLKDMCLCAHVTQQLSQHIISFLEKKAKTEKVPEALCAIGHLFTRDREMRHMDLAIQRFEEAIKLSDGRLGHAELADLYLRLDCDGKPQIFKAADHCIGMIEAGRRCGGALIAQAKIAAEILEALRTYEGTVQETELAKAKQDAIVHALDAVGVKVEIGDQKEATQNTQSMMQKSAAAPAVQDVPALLRLDDIRGADSESAHVCMKEIGAALSSGIDAASYERLRALAAQDNSFAKYVLSKIYIQWVKIGKDVSGKEVEKAVVLQDAVAYAVEALKLDPTNGEYVTQCGAAYYALFHYYHTELIPFLEAHQEVLQPVLGMVDQELEACKGMQLASAEMKKIEKEASCCLRALASRGCLHALELYLKTYLYAKDKASQKLALDIILRASMALSGQGCANWKDSGIGAVLAEHISHIEQLATKNKNGQAALIMSLWQAGEHESKSGQTETVTQIKEVIDQVFQWCTKAKEWGCKEAVPIWHMMRLARSERMTLKECKKALALLEESVPSNMLTAEFMIRLFRDGGTLPCGLVVEVDFARAKALAKKVKDKSRAALMSLMVIAKEEQDHELFLEHGIELYKRGAYSIDELVNYCMFNRIYTRSVARFLESEYKAGNLAALYGIARVKIHRHQFDEGIALLEEAITKESYQAYLELAVIHLYSEFPEYDIEKALLYLTLYIERMQSTHCNTQDIANGLDRISARLMFIISVADADKNTVLQERALVAIETVAQHRESYIGKDYESVEMLCAHVVTRCASGTLDCGSIVDMFERILVLHEKQPKLTNQANIECALMMFIKTYNETMQKDACDADVMEVNLKRFRELLKKYGVHVSFTVVNKKGTI